MIKYLLCFFLVFCTQSFAEIYRWTDDKGRVHYSDTKPTDNNYQTKEVKGTKASRLKVDLILHGLSLNADIENTIKLSVVKIHEVYTSVLGLNLGEIPPVKIRLFNDKAQFQRFYSQFSNGTRSDQISGFYTSRTGEIVLYKNRSIDRTLEVITHEASHLLLSYAYNNKVPSWLNEGLAEYFELIRLQGLSVGVPPNQFSDRRMKALLERGRLLPLNSYFKRNGNAWYLANSSSKGLYYSQAWSLVYFLMSSQEGKNTIKKMFAYLKENPWDKNINFILMDSFYPRGVEGFEKKWRQWIPAKRVAKSY